MASCITTVCCYMIRMQDYLNCTRAKVCADVYVITNHFCCYIYCLIVQYDNHHNNVEKEPKKRKW